MFKELKENMMPIRMGNNKEIEPTNIEQTL